MLPKLSLYIHIPWCIKKCFYCDFYSITKNKNLEKKYIKKIILDLKNDLNIINNRTIKTIFIGGGTPSIFTTQSINTLIKKIKKIIKIKKNAEITIESNPKNIEINKIQKFINSGINRISIGIQTFNNSLLKKIGRNHDQKESIQALNTIKNIKNINFNIDLIYGLPKQTIQQALIDIKKAIYFKPTHISWYQLNIEPNTYFYKKKPKLPTENKIITIIQKGESLLKQHGYIKYEISSYAKFNYTCQHNLNYWNFGDYIGIGCGAHSKITNKNGKIYRFEKNKNIKNYLQGIFIKKKIYISKKKKIFEYFMNKFRILKSIQYKEIIKDLNINIKTIKKKLQKAIKNKYIINNGISFKITKKGQLFLNSLLYIFL